MTTFDFSRPLWQFTLIENLVDDRAALVMKVHHSLTDGIGGAELALLLFETTSKADPGEHVPTPERHQYSPGPVKLLRSLLAYETHRLVKRLQQGLSDAPPAVMHVVRDPLRSTSDASATGCSIGRFVWPVSDTLSPVMTGRGLDRRLNMISVDFHDLKRAAVSGGGSLNDAFVASVTGGMRRYHELHGAPVGELRITMPISIHEEDDPAASNRITLSGFKIPVGVADPAERVQLTGQRCRYCSRQARAAVFKRRLAGTLNLLPSSVVGSMLKHIDLLASNVPGLNVPLYLCRCTGFGCSTFGPTTGSAVNVTLFTYCGTCFVGFTINSAAVPDCGTRSWSASVRDLKKCSSSRAITIRSKRGDGIHARCRPRRLPAPPVLRRPCRTREFMEGIREDAGLINDARRALVPLPFRQGREARPRPVSR